MVNRFRATVAPMLVLALTMATTRAQAQVPREEEHGIPDPAAPQSPDLVSDGAQPAAQTVPRAASVGIAAPVATPLRIEGASGSSMRIGLLVQPQWQAVSSPTLDGYANDLFIRRTRLLVGGTLFDRIEYFFETDYANLFLTSNAAAPGGGGDYVKSTPGMNIQDVVLTFKALGNLLKIDAGYMLPPLGHNAVQGAGTLLGWDYFAFSFQHGNAFSSSANPVGRDVGVQVRGLVLDGLLEYRLGAWQGLRENRTATEVEARNFFRVAGRLQLNLFDPEPGFFYAGTYLGTKEIASFGAAFDLQDGYRYFALDGFVDVPLGPGLFTAQVNLAHWNGGSFMPGLVKQTALMAEAGYTLSDIGLTPEIRAEQLWGSDRLPNQLRLSGGLAYWPFGHNSNLKLFYTRAKSGGAARGINQFNLQWQVYFF